MADYRDFLIARINGTPHLPLHELKDELTERGVVLVHTAVWRLLPRQGPSLKTLFGVKQKHPDIARGRQRWRFLQSWFDPERMVFIDEIGIKANMAPLRGWGRQGERVPPINCRLSCSVRNSIASYEAQ